MDTYITQINGHWYAFGLYTDTQVCSIGPDNPPSGGRWIARRSVRGIQYVATPSPSRDAAYRKARKYGEYQGEV